MDHPRDRQLRAQNSTRTKKTGPRQGTDADQGTSPNRWVDNRRLKLGKPFVGSEKSGQRWVRKLESVSESGSQSSATETKTASAMPSTAEYGDFSDQHHCNNRDEAEKPVRAKPACSAKPRSGVQTNRWSSTPVCGQPRFPVTDTYFQVPEPSTSGSTSSTKVERTLNTRKVSSEGCAVEIDSGQTAESGAVPTMSTPQEDLSKLRYSGLLPTPAHTTGEIGRRNMTLDASELNGSSFEPAPSLGDSKGGWDLLREDLKLLGFHESL